MSTFKPHSEFQATGDQPEGIRQLVEGLDDGIAHQTLLGVTGSGKTFTMMGSDGAPGVVLLTTDALFEAAAANEEHSVSITMQYVEIYNEMIKDLLEPSNATLDVREAPSKGTFVAGASRLTVSCRSELEALVHRGNLYRTTEATNVNEVSSRSHAVLQLIVESTPRFAEPPSTKELASSSPYFNPDSNRRPSAVEGGRGRQRAAGSHGGSPARIQVYLLAVLVAVAVRVSIVDVRVRVAATVAAILGVAIVVAARRVSVPIGVVCRVPARCKM